MQDLDLLTALDYLLTHHRDALIKWAWGENTTYRRLKEIQEKIEKGGELTDSNRKYIQMVFVSKHGPGGKIQEWPELENYRQVYLQKRMAKKTITSSLQGKRIPVNFMRVDECGNVIGWISLRGIDQTLPEDIKTRVFIIPKTEVPKNFKLGYIYDTICTGVTSNGAIKVKLA